ncbi:electron transfer flavoprotein subunit beta [Platysternon megacephalum]|uniref:Alkyl transferase n=1 Tax=Platysternon megacephalum TaxID=55544 RepID=A0A4D9DD71_9SAUR|nr:electron transfer flavoprotein subunit beta [Platysternon megacephalum]
MNAPRQPLEVGYQVGAAKLHEFANWCEDLGIPMITLWVLSPENFSRPAEEIGPLLEIIAKLVEDLAATGRWQVQIVGDLELLPADNVKRLLACQEKTADRQGLHINVAVSYGGRHELRDAVRSLLATKSAEGATLDELAATIEIDDISDHLYTKGQPDPDLVIRTSGEQRLSGFLIWQSAHSEFYFHEALWPDFRKVDFIRVLRTFTRRERRFGS